MNAATIILPTLTLTQIKKITKEDLISRYQALNLTANERSEAELGLMTKADILRLYNLDVERHNLIHEVRLDEGFELEAETLSRGTISQLNDLRARMRAFRQEIEANGSDAVHASLPKMNLGEISVVMQGNPLTSWLNLSNLVDTEILPYLFPEVFPRTPKGSASPAMDRVLSIVATVISSVVKKTVTPDQVTSQTYAAGAITVLERREWSDEDRPAVDELLASLKANAPTANANEPFVAPCDTNAEGFVYDEKSLICKNCADVQVCINHLQAVRSLKPVTVRAKKDLLQAPSAMTQVTIEVVNNPSITKDEIKSILEETGAKMPSDGTIVQQMGETLKHLRILAMLGYLQEDYVSRIPTPRRDMLSNPSAVAKVAIESAKEGGSRDFETVFAINQASDHPISKDAAYYQYQDSQKVQRLVRNNGVYVAA